MWKKQLKDLPSFGLICKGAEAKLTVRVCPTPKKSPSGASTLGSSSPSQYIFRSSFLRKSGCEILLGGSPPAVIQTWFMHPAPCISARVAVSPGLMESRSSLPPLLSQLEARLRRLLLSRGRSLILQPQLAEVGFAMMADA